MVYIGLIVRMSLMFPLVRRKGLILMMVVI